MNKFGEYKEMFNTISAVLNSSVDDKLNILNRSIDNDNNDDRRRNTAFNDYIFARKYFTQWGEFIEELEAADNVCD